MLFGKVIYDIKHNYVLEINKPQAILINQNPIMMYNTITICLRKSIARFLQFTLRVMQYSASFCLRLVFCACFMENKIIFTIHLPARKNSSLWFIEIISLKM